MERDTTKIDMTLSAVHGRGRLAEGRKHRITRPVCASLPVGGSGYGLNVRGNFRKIFVNIIKDY
jgi:hypothetical protein